MGSDGEAGAGGASSSGGGRKRSRSPEQEKGGKAGKDKRRDDDDSGSESDASGSGSSSSSSSSSSLSSSSASSRSDSGRDRKRHKRERNAEEAAERAKHRKEVTKRSKMWVTVGSSSDDEDGSEDGSAAAASESAGSAAASSLASGGGGKKRKKGEKEKERKKEKKRSSSSSSAKKDKKRKKEEKKHKKEKKRKKESKKDKKKKEKKSSKKKKKHKKSKGDTPASMMGAADLNTFGKYGIMRESDFHRKKRDFEVWLQEIVGLPEIPRNRHEALRHFRQYCEDYNTATFPHKKYYDVEKFEMDEYQKQQQKAAFKDMRAEGVFNDEAERRVERQKSAAQQEKEDFEWAMKMMNKDKIEAHKEEELLRAKMKQAYKSGDLATVKSIEYKLMTEEERERARYK